MRLRTSARSRAARSAGIVQLHIGHLVIEGVPLAAADAARMSGAPVHLAANGTAAVWGRQIARSIAATVSPAAASTPRARGGS